MGQGGAFVVMLGGTFFSVSVGASTANKELLLPSLGVFSLVVFSFLVDFYSIFCLGDFTSGVRHISRL